MEAAPTALEGLHYLLKQSDLLHLRSAARRFVADAGLDADFAGFDCVKPHSCTYPMMPLRRSVAHGLVSALRANASQSALTVKLHTSFEKLRNAAMPAGESDADAFAASARTVAEAQRAVARAERTSTVAVEVERYYATLGSAVWSPWGWKSMGPYQRQIRWKPGWCRSCPLLDEIVAPDAT